MKGIELPFALSRLKYLFVYVLDLSMDFLFLSLTVDFVHLYYL